MFADIAKFVELKQNLQSLDCDDSTTTVTVTYPAVTYAPIATVPVYYSTPVYYYDTSVIAPVYYDATPTYVLQ